MSVWVCGRAVTGDYKRRICFCPTCDKRRRFVVLCQEWYDPTFTCCGCGDSWTAGERDERPVRRGWRAESVAKAKRIWDEIGALCL